MTDDEILAIVDRRLGQVEPMVPPIALAGVQPSVAAPVHRGRLRPIAGPPMAILMLVIVAVLAVAVFQRPVAELGVAPSESTTVSASPPEATLSPAPSSSPSITASLEIVRGEGYGELLILQRMGWMGVCLMGADVLTVAIDPALIDRAAEEGGIEEGWVVVGDFGRFWIGPDLERAAAGIGASMLVIGEQGDPWVLLDGAAQRLIALETPGGRTYWRAIDAIRPCATSSRSPLAADLVVTGTIRQGCGSIGGCAYFITLEGPGGSWKSEFGRGARDDELAGANSLPRYLSAGTYTLTLSSVMVSDVIVNGARQLGPTDATCSAQFDVSGADPIRIQGVFDQGSCEAGVGP